MGENHATSIGTKVYQIGHVRSIMIVGPSGERSPVALLLKDVVNVVVDRQMAIVDFEHVDRQAGREESTGVGRPLIEGRPIRIPASRFAALKLLLSG